MPDKNQIKTHLCVAVAGAAVGWHHLLTSARTETEVGFSFLVVSSRRSGASQMAVAQV